MSGLFSSPSPPPIVATMPTLTPPAPMPVPDPEQERQSALQQMAVQNAGKTTRQNTIIGSQDYEDSLGGGGGSSS